MNFPLCSQLPDWYRFEVCKNFKGNKNQVKLINPMQPQYDITEDTRTQNGVNGKGFFCFVLR